jgi:hypothetical protein
MASSIVEKKEKFFFEKKAGALSFIKREEKITN